MAVSGGVDSVSLLHMLATQPDSNLHLRVAHINHGLRPDADSDERFVKELAVAYALPFHSISLDLGHANEARARELRYQFLFELLGNYQVRAIITAHHASDQLETSVMNTLRGSGRHGQAASLERSRVLRPLLNLKKSDLYDYARHYGLAWREDTTNKDTTIDRNFVRHELLGDIPDYSDHHSDLMLTHQSINRKLDGRLGKTYYTFKTAAGIEVPRAYLAEASWPVLAAFFHFVLRRLEPGHEFSRGQIEELVRVAKTAPAGSEVSLAGTLKLQVGYDKVAINVGGGSGLAQPMLQLEPQTSVTFGNFRLIYGSYQDQSATSVTLPDSRYYVRTARAGDRMRTTAGTKKIQDLFVDKKVPRNLRQGWPVVTTEDGQILWLPGLMLDPSLNTAVTGYQLIAEEL